MYVGLCCFPPFLVWTGLRKSGPRRQGFLDFPRDQGSSRPRLRGGGGETFQSAVFEWCTLRGLFELDTSSSWNWYRTPTKLCLILYAYYLDTCGLLVHRRDNGIGFGNEPWWSFFFFFFLPTCRKADCLCLFVTTDYINQPCRWSIVWDQFNIL